MIAVVFEPDFHLVAESVGAHALFGISLLRWRDGQARHLAAAMLGRVLCEPAPAASDFQNVRAGTCVDTLADFVILAHLSLFERLVRAFEIGRRIGHARIEPFFVEGVAEVVVRHDVLLGARLGIAPAERMAHHVH